MSSCDYVREKLVIQGCWWEVVEVRVKMCCCLLCSARAAAQRGNCVLEVMLFNGLCVAHGKLCKTSEMLFWLSTICNILPVGTLEEMIEW